ncbi:MAG: succinyl-diaminopimelate desuccinylase [Pseudomonadales bacterium]
MLITNELDQTTIDLATDLIKIESISPEDGGAQELIADYLSGLGFSVEHMPFSDVSNIWATHGDGSPLFVFAGHTDVVPPGPLEAWATPPFKPVVQDGILHGRGAADMKGSLAAMLTAVSRFIESHPNHPGTIGFLVTSDEEADAINGTRKVIDELNRRGVQIDWCLVGEPSSSEQLGDVVRIGRRGSLNGRLKVFGIQGHVAYPDDAKNPIHQSMQALADLVAITWDRGNEHFPPTSMQISNINAGTGANNVIPGELEVLFNFRFSTESNEASLKRKTEDILHKHQLNYNLEWSLSGDPFLTSEAELTAAVQTSIKELLDIDPHLSTSGGTSDGRFIAPSGSQVVELGPCNSTIHKVNEHVAIDELLDLSRVYADILKRLLVS